MRHRVAGKQLSRTTSHRKAMRRNMAASLFQHGAIRTTITKAKELRPFVERLITIARKGTLAARRQVIKLMQDREMWTWDKTEGDYVPEDNTVVQKLFSEIAPKYVDRPGGYTRIIRLADRRIGDAGVQVILQLVEETTGDADQGGATRRKKRASKRHEAVGKVEESAPKATATDEAPSEEDVAEQVAEGDAVEEETKDE